MANIKIPKKEFEKHIKLTQDIQDKIPMFGTPLESLSDNEVELEIFPNRPDLLSLQGYIRGLLAFLGKKPGLKQYKLNKPEKDYQVIIEPAVKNVRPFTACAIVKSLKFDDEKIKEIIDIQEKLHNTVGRNRKKVAIGIYPLEKIKLPIKYTAKKPNDIKFIPLEMDRELTGMQILSQHPAGRDYGHLLEEDKFPVFYDAAGEVLSMPPIINSHKTGKITEQTKDVFIECSGFDFQILKKTLNIIITTLADMGGKVYQMNLKYKKPEITPDLTPDKIKINKDNVNKLLGLKLNEKQIKQFVEKMGHNYNAKTNEVEIPAWRTDILHEVDIIEDIAIAYGYDKFKPEIPPVSTIGQIDNKEIIKKKISDILSGLGFLEISTYHLLTKQDYKKSGYKGAVQVEISKTDYKILRPNLKNSILKILSENVDVEYPQKIFETGIVFEEDENQETGIKETNKLVIAITPGNFTELKQVIQYLAKMLDIEIFLNEATESGFIDGRTAQLTIKTQQGESIGIIGEVSPTTLKNWKLKMPVTLLEINLEKVFELINQ